MADSTRIKRNRRGAATKASRTNYRKKFNTDLDEVFKNFIRDRKAEGVGDRAVEDYEYSFYYLKDYLDRIGVKHDLRNITEDLIRDYIVFMRDEAVRFENHRFKRDEYKTVGLLPSTINTRIKSLKTLFNRLESDQVWEDNVLANIKHLPEPTEMIDILSPEEIRELLRVPNQRSYAMVSALSNAHTFNSDIIMNSESIEMSVITLLRILPPLYSDINR